MTHLPEVNTPEFVTADQDIAGLSAAWMSVGGTVFTPVFNLSLSL
ncbi:hypothetical protein [Sporomusa sp. GT1]|nr:hypothetical protein [Sporomusa sp. GT1]